MAIDDILFSTHGEPRQIVSELVAGGLNLPVDGLFKTEQLTSEFPQGILNIPVDIEFKYYELILEENEPPNNFAA
jgi:hypothetical protein